MLNTCKNALAQGALGTCEPWGLGLTEWATILLFFGPVWKWRKRLWALIARLFGWGGSGKIRSFRSLKRAVKRLAQDNNRIFRTFGPKSRASDDGLDQFDLAAWHRARLNIKNNNERILTLLQEHFDLIPTNDRQYFTKWINHIEAFSAHLEDAAVDYRHHQFPAEIDEILSL
jgi:hypothetical protein